MLAQPIKFPRAYVTCSWYRIRYMTKTVHGFGGISVASWEPHVRDTSDILALCSATFPKLAKHMIDALAI